MTLKSGYDKQKLLCYLCLVCYKLYAHKFKCGQYDESKSQKKADIDMIGFVCTDKQLLHFYHTPLLSDKHLLLSGHGEGPKTIV